MGLIYIFLGLFLMLFICFSELHEPKVKVLRYGELYVLKKNTIIPFLWVVVLRTDSLKELNAELKKNT